MVDLDDEEAKKEQATGSVTNGDVPDVPRQSVYSTVSLTKGELVAKKRQSMTRNNYDFDILEAMKRQSVLSLNRFNPESGYKESITSVQRVANEAVAAESAALEKAELGTIMP